MVHHANAPPSTRTATPGPARSCQPFLLLAFADTWPDWPEASGFTGARVDVALGPVPGLELTFGFGTDRGHQLGRHWSGRRCVTASLTAGAGALTGSLMTGAGPASGSVSAREPPPQQPGSGAGERNQFERARAPITRGSGWAVASCSTNAWARSASSAFSAASASLRALASSARRANACASRPFSGDRGRCLVLSAKALPKLAASRPAVFKFSLSHR